jgi:Zn-dependent protease
MRNMFSVPDEGIFSGKTNDNLELLKAWAGTTLAFAIYQVGASQLLTGAFLQSLLIAGIVCGLGFVLHELAHRIVARGYGAEAHFVADVRWLILSIVISFANFFIAAPGAVWHRGYLTARQSGLIALAGPVTNLVLSAIFLLLFPIGFVAGLQENWWVQMCVIGVGLNAWLGLFNMIPAGPFDGAKVLAWNQVVFGVTVAAGILMTFVIGTGGNLIGIWMWMLSLAGF